MLMRVSGLLWLEIGSQKKERSLVRKNKISHGMRKTSHTAGTKSYARWSEDLRQNDPEKKMPHRAKVFLATHKQRAKGTDEHVRVQCNLTSQKNLLGAQADDINKERLEAQVKTSNDVDPFLSAQKCYDDTNCKEVSLQEGESSSPPFPANNGGQQEYDMDDGSSRGVQKQNKRMMSKRHYGDFEHTRAMTQKEVARNKPTSHGTSKKFHPRIKSAKYPNKDIVAYATILSSSPQAEVDGVKIGKEFYKVRINHAISENEPLVRPLSGYKMLTDVSAKRVPIAWPSICRLIFLDAYKKNGSRSKGL
ncbi:hypothetical protein QOZ80_9BG0714100 [Eleusine coracana subsp. coracana]|nr:hypothetical protein QOZ80_9BG0714100 [Eleusine coracana subsp. coracana]